jgi:two-component system sensor histidine kinase KdpD
MRLAKTVRLRGFPTLGRASGYASAVAVVTAATVVGWFVFGEAHLTDVVMVFLLGVVLVSMRFGYGPSLFAAVLTVLAFEFFFIPPLFSFAVSDLRHFVTFAVMFLVAFVISHQTKLIRDKADAARRAELLAETEKIRSALLSSVSHDFRTPLAVVMGATGALLDRPPRDEDKRRALLKTAHDEAVRLNRFLRNLLDMTRLQGGALTVKRELQPLEEVVGAALTRLDDRMADHEVTTTFPGDLPLVPFDSLLIEQVFVNLLENAAKHTPPGAAIDVAARVVEGTLEVEVADRGPGVAPSDFERVFDKFFRANEREGGGAGLGLTICRGVVAAHGGRIWVEARPGGGASFRFTLPLSESVGQDAGTAPVSSEKS